MCVEDLVWLSWSGICVAGWSLQHRYLSETCWVHKKWNKIASDIKLVFYSSTNEMLLAMNNKVTVDGIFCDLEKAFSCVNHNILMLGLEFYGILVKFNILIKSYLKGSYQRVLIYNRNTHNSSLQDGRKSNKEFHKVKFVFNFFSFFI